MTQLGKFRTRLVAVSLAIALLLGASVAYCDDTPGTVHLGGDVTKPADWNAELIHKELAADIKAVQYTSKGDAHTANCIALVDLLKAAGVKTELKMDPKAEARKKNQPLRYVVLVQATDGYVVAFSLAELMPDVGNRPVWVALDMDGQPLSQRDGPLRLIVPGDQKPARWVHAIGSITVVNAAAPTTSPAQ